MIQNMQYYICILTLISRKPSLKTILTDKGTFSNAGLYDMEIKCDV